MKRMLSAYSLIILLLLISGCSTTSSLLLQIEERENEAREIREQIKELVQEDPDTALKDFITELDKVLVYADTVKDNPSPGDLEFISGVVETAKLNVELREALNRTIETDFGKGHYALSDLAEEKKGFTREFVQQIVEIKEDFVEKYPNQQVVIKIKIVGYTDQVGFREGTQLMENLMQGVENEVPEKQPERRQFLNQRLSLFRAQTLDEYIRQLLSELDQGNSKAQIETDTEGKGEELPPGISSPYPKSDDRRRICKISATLRNKGERI